MCSLLLPGEAFAVNCEVVDFSIDKIKRKMVVMLFLVSEYDANVHPLIRLATCVRTVAHRLPSPKSPQTVSLSRFIARQSFANVNTLGIALPCAHL